MKTTIDASAVEAITRQCLYTPEETSGLEPGKLPDGAIVAKGIVVDYGFHPERLKEHREEITQLLLALPKEFQTYPGGGSGWSFLNACMDASGAQWGEHVNVEQLMCLGLASGLVRYCLPREMWYVLPGGMPYFMVLIPEAQP